MIHAVKCEKQYFEKVAAGTKPYELRKDDRGYKVGDFLALNEIESADKSEYTGRCLITKITDVFKNNKFLQNSIAVLTILPCEINEAPNTKNNLLNFYSYKPATPGVYGEPETEITSEE